MNAIYILIWMAHVVTFKTCSQNESKVNPYSGRVESPQVEVALACFDSTDIPMKQEFTSKEAAEDFMRGCTTTENFAVGTTCSDWKLEEVHQ